MKYVIGLGNPGRKYAKTRHNVGWLVLDELIGKNKWQESKKLPGFYFWTKISEKEIELIKPTTFMNNSGRAVAYVKKKYNLKPEDFIVIHDDKDLEFGQIKIEPGRGSAGHNGVQSVIDALGSKDFWRVRIGVKNELLEKMETDKFVLSKFNRQERKELPRIIKEAIELIEDNI